MKVHYDNAFCNSVIAEIDQEIYTELLKNHEGLELVTKMDEALTVTNRDPRQSELEECDVFFSYDDVKGNWSRPADLLIELEEAMG